MSRFPLLFLATLLLAAAAAPAQDEVGFYFDTDGLATTYTTTTPGEYVQGWLILKDATALDGIGSWRSEIRIELPDGTPVSTQWMYLGGAQNFDAPPSFDVATFTPMPWVQDLALATVLIQVPDPADEVSVYLSGHRFPVNEAPMGYPVNKPEYGHGVEYVPAAMTRAFGSTYVPLAVINDDGVAPTLASVSVTGSYQGYTYVGANISGTVSLAGQSLLRPLEGEFGFNHPGLEYRRVPTDSGYPGLDPSPWVTGPVTSRLEVFPLSTTDRFEYRITPTEAGTLDLGVTFTAGNTVYTHDQLLTVYPTPCSVTGLTYSNPNGSIEDGILEFHPHVAAYLNPTGYVSVHNIGDTEIYAAPRLTGSPAFVVVNPAPFTLQVQGYGTVWYHTFNLVFSPTTSGWHEAELTFEGDSCASVILRGYAVPSGVSDAGDLPAATRLMPAYPNPFNPSTTVSFELGRAGRARLAVYGLDGRLVTVLADEQFEAGPAQRTWSGRDAAGRTVASGVYLVRLEAGDVRETQRITLLK